MAASELLQLSWSVAMETLWYTELKTFTLWPFIEKVCHLPASPPVYSLPAALLTAFSHDLSATLQTQKAKSVLETCTQIWWQSPLKPNVSSCLSHLLPDLLLHPQHYRFPWWLKNSSATRETWVRSLRGKDPLEKGKATHSNILVWKIPWAV